jgi:hypothetical protein
MSVQELTMENLRLQKERDDIRSEQLAINAELTMRYAQERARQLAESMSDEEKAALAQAISVEGIDSSSGVGTPGE